MSIMKIWLYFKISNLLSSVYILLLFDENNIFRLGVTLKHLLRLKQPQRRFLKLLTEIQKSMSTQIKEWIQVWKAEKSNSAMWIFRIHLDRIFRWTTIHYFESAIIMFIKQIYIDFKFACTVILSLCCILVMIFSTTVYLKFIHKSTQT